MSGAYTVFRAMLESGVQAGTETYHDLDRNQRSYSFSTADIYNGSTSGEELVYQVKVVATCSEGLQTEATAIVTVTDNLLTPANEPPIDINFAIVLLIVILAALGFSIFQQRRT